MSEPLIDVPEIYKRITEKHEAFIKSFGPQIQKVVADHRLQTDIVLARMYRIVICFKEAGIFDDAIIRDTYPLKSINLSKKGFDNYIILTTNGQSVMIEGFGYTLGFGSDVTLAKKRIDGVQDEDYDWTDFAMELLDHIHMAIYERKKACETKIDSLLQDNE
jgi:hypothetical protein